MIGKTISHYKILDKLGEGGMGVVYKAEDTQLQRLVALKFLPPHIAHNPEEKTRFLQEARSASALNHPNLTTIYGIQEAPEGIFIVMEFVEGKTLKQLTEKESPPIKRVLEIAIQVCEGLAAAHKKEIIHRDIKSDNIMLTKEGQVKIMDFGLAKLKGATKLTKAGSTLGTAAYMSPEQASGEEVDQRSDIFSFGVVLYELLAGQLPFKGEHQAAIVYSIMNEEPQPVARYNNKVSPDLERIVSKSLAKDTEERYQHIDDLLADLRRERKSLDYLRTGQIPLVSLPGKPKRKLLPILIPGSIILVLAVLFLILQPFKVEIGTEQKAIAQENSLAIMYFENLVDREDKNRTGEIVTNLLITDLSESKYVQVVSSQRLYDILKLLGQEGAKVIDRSKATQIAEKAGSKWMLLGSILQTEPDIILTSQLVEVKSGNVIASQRIQGQAGENIFSLVDKLSAELRQDLTLPAEAQQEFDPKVAEVTTHSPEAYRYYLEGVDYVFKLYHQEAIKSFEKALEYDSTLAMAYFWLANQKRGSIEFNQMVEKAVKYSGKVSQKEKIYIRVLQLGQENKLEEAAQELKRLIERYPEEKQAYMGLADIYRSVLHKPQEAIQYLNKVIEIDPTEKNAYNLLAYAYDKIGDLDKSIWAINQYITLVPEEPNPYDTRGDLYSYNGKLDQAIESYKRALEKKPDFYMSLAKLGHMYLYKKDYAEAESCYQALTSSGVKEQRAFGRLYLAYAPLYQGKFNEALKVLEEGIAADRMEKVEGWDLLSKYATKALVYEERGPLDSALALAQLCGELDRKFDPEALEYFRDFKAYFLAKKGDIPKAEAVAESLRKDIEKKDKQKLYIYWLIFSFIQKQKGNHQQAMEQLERAIQENPNPEFSDRYFLAQALLDNNRLDEAVAELERILKRYDEVRIHTPIWAVKAYFFLAQAYDKSGWKQKAIDKYTEFLEIWKKADPDIKEVEEAKKRLAELKNST